uniref:Uncharacterized protein n=1 Tax=Panagrolaimus sp. PS1159 TaxID=55785 RepID=A0AC35FFM1_9BILA
MDNSEVNDVTVQEDNFDDGEEWSDAENDEENLPPRSTTINKESNIRSSNLEPITEESRANYSRYSQHHSNDKDSDEITQRTQAPTPATATATKKKPRKESISFGSDSFGKVEDLDKVLKEQEEDCHERNHLRPRLDVTHESRIRSWESPPASLNITRVSQQSYSKPFTTSTPIAGRVPGPFDAGVSVIPDVSRLNLQNESSTLSNTKMNYLIQDVVLGESSVRNARNFVLQSKHIPKPSKILDDLKRNRTNSRVNSSISNVVQRQPGILPKPVLQQVPEGDSLPSTSASTAAAAEIVIKPEPLTNFGCVAIGEEVLSKIYVKNCLSHILEVTPRLTNKSGCFKLASNGSVQIQPNCSQEFIVILSPHECRRYQSFAKFYVSSSGKTYSHPLLAYGGTADVKIVEKRTLSYFPRSGIYRFAPSNITSFGFEVKNFGDRAAFVYIVAVDTNGTEARNITVQPKSFCLTQTSNNPDDSSKVNITVKVPENFLQSMSRISMDSVRSSSTSATRSNIFSLKVYFGDERLRQRAKKYSDDNNQHESVQGLWLTKTSFGINGKDMNAADDYLVSRQDIEILQAQTRVLTLLIGDDRIEKHGTLSLPSRPQSSYSNRGRGIDSGYYIPECNNDGDSTMVTVADPERTLMK